MVRFLSATWNTIRHATLVVQNSQQCGCRTFHTSVLYNARTTTLTRRFVKLLGVFGGLVLLGLVISQLGVYQEGPQPSESVNNIVLKGRHIEQVPDTAELSPKDQVLKSVQQQKSTPGKHTHSQDLPPLVSTKSNATPQPPVIEVVNHKKAALFLETNPVGQQTGIRLEVLDRHGKPINSANGIRMEQKQGPTGKLISLYEIRFISGDRQTFISHFLFRLNYFI